MVIILHHKVKILHKGQIVILYKLFAERQSDREHGAYTTYGISVCRDSSVVRVIGDITVDRDKAEALIDLFNQERLSPAQLDEAVENFLYDFEV